MRLSKAVEDSLRELESSPFLIASVWNITGIFRCGESNNNRIQVLTRDGQALYKVGNTFDHPLSFITHKNLLFVSNSQNNCISVSDVSGKFWYKFGRDLRGS